MVCKVIIADPSPSVQKAVQMAFGEPGFELYPFTDGGALIPSILRIHPDAVLVSLSLPGRDGYEVGRYLRSREEFKKTVLFLLRNSYETLDLERLRGIDYDGIVLKPFDSEKLARDVRDLVDGRKGPPTFPEESLLEDPPASGAVPLFEESEFEPPPVSNLPRDEEIEEKVRQLLREEVLLMERELEKRLKAVLRSELPTLLETELRKKP